VLLVRRAASWKRKGRATTESTKTKEKRGLGKPLFLMQVGGGLRFEPGTIALLREEKEKVKAFNRTKKGDSLPVGRIPSTF